MFRSLTLKRLVPATLGALLLALAASAPAGAAWSQPKYLNSQFIPAELPAEIATDSDEFYFVFAESSGMVKMRKYSGTGASQGGATLTPRPSNPEQELSAELPNVGANEAGDTAYAWLTSNNAGTRSIVQARTRTAAGQLGSVKTVADIGQSEGEIDLPEVAVDADGDAIVAWTQEATVGAETAQVKARTLSKTGELGATKTVSQDSTRSLAEFVQVGMRPNGEAVFAWAFETNAVEGQVQTRTLSPSGELSRTRNVSRLDSTFPDFSMAPDGDALFAWIYADPFSGGKYVQARTMSASGELGKFHNISPRGSETLEHHAAYNSNGVAAFTYTVKDPILGKTALYGRNMSATGTLGKSRELAGATQSGDVTFPDVGISNSGRAVFSWLRPTAAGNRLEANTLTSAGVLGTKRTVTSGKLFENRMAVAPTGPAAVSWVDQEFKRVGAAFGP